MTSVQPFEYLLMTPGPVQVPPAILKEIGRPMIHHRTPEFEKILSKTLSQLKELFQTKQKVFLHASTGSGAMESAVVNVLSPADTAIVIVSGKFGERWRDICKVYGIKVLSLEVPWGESVDPTELQKLLKEHPETKAVFCQACETSTAVLHPIQKISKVVHENSQALMIVDAITAIGVTNLPMDEWKLDVVIAGSQKSFMLPAGLSMISLSEKAWAAAEKSQCPKYYWDLKKERKANEAGQTLFSSPVNLVRGLSTALDLLLSQGLKKNIEKFEKLSAGLRKSGEVLGLQVFAKTPATAVTAFVTPIDSEKLRDHLESKYNMTLMGGQDQLKGKILRVGTLGYVTADDVRETIKRLHLGLLDFGVKSDLKKALDAFESEL